MKMIGFFNILFMLNLDQFTSEETLGKFSYQTEKSQCKKSWNILIANQKEM